MTITGCACDIIESDPEYQKRREGVKKKATSVEDWFSAPKGGYGGIKEKPAQGELHGLDEIWMFHCDMEL